MALFAQLFALFDYGPNLLVELAKQFGIGPEEGGVRKEHAADKLGVVERYFLVVEPFEYFVWIAVVIELIPYRLHGFFVGSFTDEGLVESAGKFIEFVYGPGIASSLEPVQDELRALYDMP